MPHFALSTFSVTKNRFQQNEYGSTTSASATNQPLQLNQSFSSSTRQYFDQNYFRLAIMTTRIEVLVKLFSLSAFQTVKSSSPSLASSICYKQTFALGCTVLLLLVPFQVCQAMVVLPTVVPLSKHSKGGNEVLMSSQSSSFLTRMFCASAVLLLPSLPKQIILPELYSSSSSNQ